MNPRLFSPSGHKPTKVSHPKFRASNLPLQTLIPPPISRVLSTPPTPLVQLGPNLK